MGSTVQAAPQSGGLAARRRTEARVMPVTKMHEVKNSGEGHTRLFGHAKNFGGLSLRLGPKTPQQKRSGPTSHAASILIAARSGVLASAASLRAVCCR